MRRRSWHISTALLIAMHVAIRLDAQVTLDGGEPREPVMLNRIWTRMGTEQMQVGLRVASMGDLNGDGLGDFAVQRRDSLEIFAGARPLPSTTPMRVVPGDSAMLWGYSAPALGDFWGTGHRAVCLVQGYDIVIYRTESGLLADAPSARVTNARGENRTRFYFGMDAADIDKDGYDELLVASAVGIADGQTDRHAEIWIFRGGPDFSTDEPDVIVRDVESNAGYSAGIRCGDIDGDGQIDLAFTSVYEPGQIGRLKIYFGNGRLDGFSELPDVTAADKIWKIYVADVDGDNTADLLTLSSPPVLYRSGSGKNARTRSYTPDDADFIDVTASFSAVLGPLNDNSGRYDMIAGLRFGMRAFSGGPGGPDQVYDAWYSATADGFITEAWNDSWSPVGDVNGDGWSDVLFGSDRYPSDVMRAGLAIILSGGAYIPRDSFEVSAVRDIAVSGVADAITVWPLPAREQVTVAWRGDLRSMPSAIEVFDAVGRSVWRKHLGHGASHERIDCSSWPNGVYLLVLRDGTGRVIATTRVPRM